MSTTSGGLFYRRVGGWYGRFWATVDGERIRVVRKLGTHSKPVARAKLERLKAEGETSRSEAKRSESFEEAARRIVARKGAEGMKTWRERLGRLERFAFPEIGAVPVEAVTPEHVRTVIEAMHEAGKSKGTCTHVRNDVGGVLGELWRDGAIPENPIKRVRLPKQLRRDRRPRVVPTDAEFALFLATPCRRTCT